MESYILISVVAGTIAMLGYGLSNLLGSIVSKREDPISINIWYFSVSAAILAAIALVFYRPFSIGIYGIALLAVTSVFSVLGLVSFIKGLRIGKLSVVAPISSIFSIIPIIIGVVFLAETPTLMQYAGIALALTGTALASFELRGISSKKRAPLLPGVKYGILTMISWGIFYTGIGILSKSLGWAYPALIATAVSAAILVLYSRARRGSMGLPRNNLLLTTLWAIMGTIGLVSYSLGTEYGSMSLVSPITASEVLVTVMLGFIVLKEKLSKNQVLGICIIIIGIIMIAL